MLPQEKLILSNTISTLEQSLKIHLTGASVFRKNSTAYNNVIQLSCKGYATFYFYSVSR